MIGFAELQSKVSSNPPFFKRGVCDGFAWVSSVPFDLCHPTIDPVDLTQRCRLIGYLDDRHWLSEERAYTDERGFCGRYWPVKGNRSV